MFKGLKKWLAKSVQEELTQQLTISSELGRPNKLLDMFSNNLPAMVVFRIDNGYIVRVMNQDTAYVERGVGFVYCADHQAIADYIVTVSAKEKLGIQRELFGTTGAATMAKTPNAFTCRNHY